MKTKHYCLVAVILAMGTVCTFGGPYTIDDRSGTIVEMGNGYDSTSPIGNGPHGVCAIEFSQDGFIYGVDPSSGTLVMTDPATGVSETVGSLGIAIEPYAVDLDEDESGQLRMLYTVNHTVYLIDRETGVASLECQSTNPDIWGLASFDGRLWTSASMPDPPDTGCGLEYISHDGFFGTYLELGPDGWIHSTFASGAGWVVVTGFSRIQPTIGVIDHLGSFTADYGLSSLTFDPTEQPPAPAIPALNRIGTLFLVLILIAAGVSTLLRRS